VAAETELAAGSRLVLPAVEELAAAELEHPEPPALPELLALLEPPAYLVHLG